ncbi:GNAT family N-acetyltransferase [Photobacterium atrarenae]|uniref:GNAT family N-acetyltransferase n=1 Tax=Photobacterium atrarenae TaxID=865757 RepID=A0ABY5GN60_9GAMM|nr:GNAT family N-acetyltransferase [Photobacterium atrarenae]UTV30540.1 GNAT family N-acetyltransferase [Photobacterium atrarenae]
MIREMTKEDFAAFWPCFESVIKAQETYAFDPEMNFEAAYQLWCATPLKAFVFVEGGQVLGSYYIRANGMGPSNHICNCGYMVTEAAQGKGIARQLCEHSQQIAIELGFEAMQFNSVVSTNTVAVKLWQKLGYQIIGTIPRAYRHKQLGYVDSYIMHKQLQV